ncbi:MAG: TSUP family transporter [Bacteroidota bacterium]
MSFNEIFLLLVIGLAAGFIAGGLGVGGGIILVPALVFFFGLTQHQAQGTSLGVLMFPVMALAVVNYYQKGFVNFKLVFILVAAFLVGSYLGSLFSVNLPAKTLKKVFGILMLIAGMKMILEK